MAQLNTGNLETILKALAAHVGQLNGRDAINQPAIDNLAQVANNLDQSVIQIIQTPDPGPRTDLDFSALDAAVSAFKQNTKISQTDANNVAGLIHQNTPR